MFDLTSIVVCLLNNTCCLLVASRVEAQWDKNHLKENVTSLHTTIDELSHTTIKKLIAAHIS